MKTGKLFAVVILLALAWHFLPQYLKQPTPVVLQVNGQDTHVADTWQEWTIQYEGGETATISSDIAPVLLQVPVKSACACVHVVSIEFADVCRCELQSWRSSATTST
jgi:hypothetical protein